MPAGAADAIQPLWTLLVLFAAAKCGEEIFERLHLPGLVGQIVAGFVVGPPLLHWVPSTLPIRFLAQMGVIFLLFETGLQTQPEDLFERGQTSLAVATLGVLTPLAVGWMFAVAIGENAVTARFVGTLLVATSIGITAKVLGDFGALETEFGRVILGAAVLDDILGLLALSTLQSVATGNGTHWINLALTVGFVALFLGLVLWLRRAALPGMQRRVGGLRAEAPQWTFALVLLFAFSAMSASIGLAAIVGAFVAGMFMSGTESGVQPLRERAAAVSSFVVPFFLADIGMRMSPGVLRAQRSLALLAALTLIAILTKLVACSLASWRLGWRSARLIGLGMIPRGEVGIVVAAQSLRLAAVPAAYYSIGVAVAVLTSIIGPLLLRAAMRRQLPRLRGDFAGTTAA